MCGAYLPGGRRVELGDVPVPVPGHGQVLVAMRASSISGSDLRAIYRQDARAAVLDLTGGVGCEVAVDCSGSAAGRAVALGAARRFGRCVFVGESGRLEIDVSPLLIHRHLTVMGSWVTSIGRMEELVDRLARWDLHPEKTVTDTFPLDQAAAAYELADGAGGARWPW